MSSVSPNSDEEPTPDNTAADEAQPVDVTSPRMRGVLQIGRLINEIEHRLQLMWLLGRDTEASTNDDVPWQSLREQIRMLMHDEQSREDADQRLQRVVEGWNQVYGTEWHAEYWHEHNDAAWQKLQEASASTGRTVRQACEELLGTVRHYVEDLLCVFHETLTGNEISVLQLGRHLDRLEHPVPVFRVLTESPALAGDQSEPQLEDIAWQCQPREPMTIPRVLPVLPLLEAFESYRDGVHAEVHMRCRELQVNFSELAVDRFHEMERPAYYLGLRLRGNELSRANMAPVTVTSFMMRNLISMFIESRGRPVNLQELTEKWEEMGGRTGLPETSLVSERICRTNQRYLRPFGVEIKSAGRSQGWRLQQVSGSSQ